MMAPLASCSHHDPPPTRLHLALATARPEMMPSFADVYGRAEVAGHRRIAMPLRELIATGFVAGFTIVFGIIAFGIVHALVTPELGPGIGKVGGALAFGVGVVFLITGRSELFSESFLDPVAAAMEQNGPSAWGRLARLWCVILALNLVGGTVLALIVMPTGALPAGAHESLVAVAEEIALKSPLASLSTAVAAGALLTMLSFMLHAADSTASRITVAYAVGFFLALGPFNHVVVTSLHMLFGILFGGNVTYGNLFMIVGISVPGNMLGGLAFTTLVHMAAAKRSTDGR